MLLLLLLALGGGDDAVCALAGSTMTNTMASDSAASDLRISIAARECAGARAKGCFLEAVGGPTRLVFDNTKRAIARSSADRNARKGMSLLPRGDPTGAGSTARILRVTSILVRLY